MGCDLRGREGEGRSSPPGRAICLHYQILTLSRTNGFGGLVVNRTTKCNAAAHQRTPLRSHPRPPSAYPRHTAGTIAIPAAPNLEDLLVHSHAALAKLDGCHAPTSDLARSWSWFPCSVPGGQASAARFGIRCGPQERRAAEPLRDWPNSRLTLSRLQRTATWRSQEPAQRIHNPRGYSLSG